jgi:hypothetical protein
MADGEYSVRFYAKVLGESTVLRNAVRSQIEAEQKVTAHAVKAFAA